MVLDVIPMGSKIAPCINSAAFQETAVPTTNILHNIDMARILDEEIHNHKNLE